MALASKNSLDLLRLVAASLVLFSHQHALLGVEEPLFLGWTSFGGAGVSIFFFLSGFLVWSSWARDPDFWRFFIRRSLRIFPGLWLVVMLTVFVAGPWLSSLAWPDYFVSSQTWRYLSTSLLLVRQSLPGVFANNPYPLAVNGSLWTLPVEFLCYVSVAVMGCLGLARLRWLLVLGLGAAVLAAFVGPWVLGARFTPHFEMVAFFWWGVWYGYLGSAKTRSRWPLLGSGAVALLVFLMLGARGVDRTAMLLFAAAMVVLALKTPIGARLTDRLGDLSYGMYIFAFPVQQVIVQMGLGRGWTMPVQLGMSFCVTAGLAYVSWHLVEKRALRFKPKVGMSA